MNRRQFILGSIASGVSIGGVAWMGIKQNEGPLDIDFALSILKKLKRQEPRTTGEWNLYQIITHCAQSVEYSMLGYPEHKSDMFKHTVGKVAFSLFSSKRKMRHALDEAIPSPTFFIWPVN